MRQTQLIVLLGLVLLVSACDRNTAKGKPLPAPKAATPTRTPPAKAGSGGLSGTVAETMDSAGYTYVKLNTAAGEQWAAVSKTPLKIGQKLNVTSTAVMKNFKSPTLKRVFPIIHFGTLGGGKAAGPHGMSKGPHGMGKGPHGMGKGKGMVHGKGKGMVHGKGSGAAGKVDVSRAHAGLGKKKVTVDKPVTKAQGADGYTVAGLFAKKASLKDKKVEVRGKVVKVNKGIMGRNWLHLQDGTGSAAAANFDLTVTSQGVATVGQVVLIKGVLRLNKDFGSGYRYAVIVEDAKVVK